MQAGRLLAGGGGDAGGVAAEMAKECAAFRKEVSYTLHPSPYTLHPADSIRHPLSFPGSLSPSLNVDG